MLGYEFDRLRVVFNGDAGLCTLNSNGEKLVAACQRYGIRRTAPILLSIVAAGGPDASAAPTAVAAFAAALAAVSGNA